MSLGEAGGNVVFVAGATGAVGKAAAHHLAAALRPADTLVVLGRSSEKVAVLARQLAGANCVVRSGLLDVPGAGAGGEVDCEVPLLERLQAPGAARRVVFLNAIGPSCAVTLPLARHVLGRGAHFVDLGGSQRIIDGLDGVARQRGVVALCGAGVQPGLAGALLHEAGELLAHPSEATARVLVGGRQALSAGALEEYLNSFDSDGGWPGAVWHNGAVHRAGAGAAQIARYWREPGSGAKVAESSHLSVHLDEDYVDVARSLGLGTVHAVNVMDSPATVDALRRYIAGEIGPAEVLREASAEVEKPYFGITVRAGDGEAGVEAEFRCRDSYRASGELAGEVAAELLRLPGTDVGAGAGWACSHEAARCWLQHPGVRIELALKDGRTRAATPGGAVVVGAGFGAHYAAALARPESPVRLRAIAGQGGAAGRRLAETLGVSYLHRPAGATLPQLDQFPADAAAAVVAVRGELVGGQGDELAAELLDAGIAVLQELPVAPETAAAQLRRAREAGTIYQVTGLYEHTPPVRAVVEAVAHLRKRSTITHVHLRTCYQLLDRVGLILAEALDAVPVGPVRIAETASSGWKLVSGRWGRIPVDIMLAHRMDPDDPDNFCVPMASLVCETEDGELSWTGPASPPRWQQRPHSAGNRFTQPDAAVDQPWCDTALGDWPESWGEVTDKVWPAGIQRAVSELCRAQGGSRRAGYDAATRRSLHVLRWWKQVCGMLPPPEVIAARDAVRIASPQLGASGEAER